jgi:3-methyladenine DNA glycosylase AlkD
MKDRIIRAFESSEVQNAATGTKIANKYYKELPKDDTAFLREIEPFIFERDMRLFSVATQWLKKRKSILDMKYIDTYEKWVEEALHGWGKCDQFCYRLMNPLLAKYPNEVYEYCLKWIDSDDFSQKRVGIVALTGSSLTVVGPFERVSYICDKMKHDEDVLIQKAVGWILKCSYKEYPNELVDYLKKNVSTLTRTTFRYALEKMPKELKQELMKL